jgi:hypothetical protein
MIIGTETEKDTRLKDARFDRSSEPVPATLAKRLSRPIFEVNEINVSAGIREPAQEALGICNWNGLKMTRGKPKKMPRPVALATTVSAGVM